MSNLIDIAKKYKSTKHKAGFFPIYEKYFKDFRNKNINLLEIGIDKGDSLRIWSDYFPNANICAIDIEKKDFNIKNVNIFIGDQSDNQFLENIASKYKYFDIIIDDGSHFSKDIISSFNTLYPYLKNDGFYIIEDLQTSYFPRFGGSRIRLNKKNTSMNFLKKIADSVNYEQFDRPFYSQSKYDGCIKSIYFYQNFCLVKKGTSNKFYY